MTAGSLLIVDDNELTCRALAACFTREGFAVRVGRSGEQALELTRSDPCDLVLLDIGLPGANGFAVLEALRDRLAAGQPEKS